MIAVHFRNVKLMSILRNYVKLSAAHKFA